MYSTRSEWEGKFRVSYVTSTKIPELGLEIYWMLLVRVVREHFHHTTLPLHLDSWPPLHPLSFTILSQLKPVPGVLSLGPARREKQWRLGSHWDHTLFCWQVRLCLTWVTQSRAWNKHLRIGGLFGKWVQTAGVKEWEVWDRDGEKANVKVHYQDPVLLGPPKKHTEYLLKTPT